MPLKFLCIIIGLPHEQHDDVIPVDSEKFLVTHIRQFSLVQTDDLSITSFETYTKDKPQILAQNNLNNATSDAEHNYNANLSMHPVMSNTDDDDNIDDDVDDYALCIQCISHHDHPGTFEPSTYQQQHTCGKINYCHPTKYSRKHY